MSNIEPRQVTPTSDHQEALAATYADQVALAQIGAKLAGRNKKMRSPRLMRKDRHRLLAAKIEQAGVRSAAGLANRGK